MLIRKAELKDLQRIQELNNELFELELANFDKYLIKGWPLSNEGKIYFENAIKESFVIVAEIDNKDCSRCPCCRAMCHPDQKSPL